MTQELLLTVEVNQAELLTVETNVTELEIGKPYYLNTHEGFCGAYQVIRLENSGLQFIALWEKEDKGDTVVMSNDGIGEGVVGQIVTINEDELELVKEYFEKHDEYFPEHDLEDFDAFDYFYIGIASCVHELEAPEFINKAVVNISE